MGVAPGEPDCDVIDTPAIRPCNAVPTSPTGCFAKTSPLTEATAPVISLFLDMP